MKLLTGGKDISQLIEKITWSGDTSQVSRKINFTIAQNKKILYSRMCPLTLGMKLSCRIMKEIIFSAGLYLMRIKRQL